MAAPKANPFAKLDAKKATSAAAAPVDETAAPEADEVVVAAKTRIAAKQAARTAQTADEATEDDAPAAPVKRARKVVKTIPPIKSVEPEVEEELEDEADEVEDEGTPAVLEDDTEDEDDTEAEEPEEAPAPKITRRTAKQVELEAEEREAKLQRQIDELSAKLSGKADSAEITVLQDRVVLEDGVGGDVRVVGGGKTLVNNDWRCTIDGLRLILGRASNQSTQQFQIPATLVSSLAELLANVTEIQD